MKLYKVKLGLLISFISLPLILTQNCSKEGFQSISTINQEDVNSENGFEEGSSFDPESESLEEGQEKGPPNEGEVGDIPDVNSSSCTHTQVATNSSNLESDSAQTVLPNQSIAAGLPLIQKVSGKLSPGQTLTISGLYFSEKANSKPLFWWKADLGSVPSPLGRKKSWDSEGGIGGFSNTVVAPGSKKSVSMDHGKSSGAALSKVKFDSDRLYLYRKTFEDFDISKDYAIKTRVILLSGTPKVGELVTGTDSGATGRIVLVKADPGPGRTHAIFYDNHSGTINQSPRINFIKGEPMKSVSGARMTNAESVGTYRTFNFKTMRFWSKTGNNIHFNAQGANRSHDFNITPEYTAGTTWSSKFTLQSLAQVPRKWKVEELEYETSSIDSKDGTWNFYQDGILGTDNPIKMRTTQRPDRYTWLVQSQVSHLAQPGSKMYYDSLYIDDSWHRVVLCNKQKWGDCGEVEVQIPAEWTSNEITVHVNLGGFSSTTPLFLYVIDKEGVANNLGFPMSLKCIEP